MSFLRPAAITVVGAALAAISACSDGTGPAAPPEPIFSIDEQTPIARVEELRSVFYQPMIVSLSHSLAFVDVLFEFGHQSQVAGTALPEGTSVSGFRLLRSIVPTTPTLANTIVDEAKGKTYVFGTESFVPDASLTGAPANGVRVIMHGWERNAEAPTLPLTRLGYAEFAPLTAAAASSEALRARLVRDADDVVLADYTVSHATSGDQETLGVEGTVTDGARSARFDATETFTVAADTRLTSFHSRVSDPSRGVGAELAIAPAQNSSTNRTLLTITYDSHVFTLAYENFRTEVKLDGRLYAVATVSESREIWSKADGTELTIQELEDLNGLIDSGLFAILRFHDVVWF